VSRIIPALATFLAVVGLANWLGTGHGYGALLALAGLFFLVRALPERGIRWLLAATFAFSVVVAALAIVQMWFMPRARGPFISPNSLGAFAVLMVFCSLEGPGPCGKMVRGSRLAAGANLLSLALSQSRGAILALGAGLAVMLYRKRPILAVVSAAVALAVVLLIRTGAAEARTGIWLIALQAASQRLVLGYGQNGLWISGLGTFYSIPLQWLANAGILGVMSGGWLLYEGMRAARDRPALQAFLVAWFVQGLFFFSIPATSIPLFAVLGYLARDSMIPAATQSRAVTTTIAPKPSGSVRGHHFIRRPG
jgi:hypothetical protein